MARGEPVLHRAIAIRAEGQGPCAGGLEASVAVAPAQAHEPQAGAIALLGVRAAPEDLGHQPPGGRAGLFSPADEPRRRPLGMRPVGLGYVLRRGRRLGRRSVGGAR